MVESIRVDKGGPKDSCTRSTWERTRELACKAENKRQEGIQDVA